MNSLVACKGNKKCPCGEYCDLRTSKCKRATCNKKAKGGKIKVSNGLLVV